MIATRIAAPTKAPRIVPRPPESATPPRTAATIELSSKPGPTKLSTSPTNPLSTSPEQWCRKCGFVEQPSVPPLPVQAPAENVGAFLAPGTPFQTTNEGASCGAR